MMNDEEGDSPDLDTARGLVPAIMLGAAFWAIVITVAILHW